MSKFIHAFIRDLDHTSMILKLLKEIEMVTHFPVDSYVRDRGMVIHYLRDYRSRRPITKESLDAIPLSDSLLLRQKVKKLHDTDLYWLCHEIAQLKSSGVEKNAGKSLYVFLDQFLKEDKKRSKRELPGYLIP